MDSRAGVPLEVLFVHRFEIDGKPAIVQFPSGWSTVTGKAKIRVLSVTAKQIIPLVLKNETLLVFLDEIPANSLLFSDVQHGESLAVPLLTALHVYQKPPTAELKMRVRNGGGAVAYRDSDVTKLTVSLRSFPKNSSLSSVSLLLQFHVQLL